MTDITTRKLSKILLWTVGVLLLLLLIYLLSNIIVIIIISVLLMFIFHPLVTMLEQEGFNRLYVPDESADSNTSWLLIA